MCQGLLTNLQSRWLRTDRSLLVILDGAQALHTAVTQTFGPAALVQRCQVHKRRNVLEYLPVRLEFPILSLHPGLRQRCVAPDVWPTLSRA